MNRHPDPAAASAGAARLPRLVTMPRADEPTHDERIDVPRGALWGVAALLSFTLLATGLVRWAGDGRSPTVPTTAVVAEVTLQFTDLPDGGLAVREADTGRLLDRIAPGGEPFVRGALRALARERRSQGLDAVPPFRLSAHADGRLSLVDTATQRRIDVGSFGPTQAVAFARLLPAPASTGAARPPPLPLPHREGHPTPRP